jgi:G6PDH family F420-dependent oxidoreductase
VLKLGYKLMSEEHGPNDLVRNAARAEEAGFAFAAISDHFSPWLEEQGHAPLAWPVLGAIAHATNQIGLMTAVTCPLVRYHPAVIAQGAATLGLLCGSRFTLGLGSGERLNEHIIGAGWPGRVERRERFGEAIDIIQGLLSGTLTNYRGRYYQRDNARLFDRPESEVPVALAAGGPHAARLAGEKGEALIATEPRSDLSRLTRQAAETDPVMPKFPCVMPLAKTRPKQPRTASSAGPLLGGQSWPSCPIPKGSPRRAGTSRRLPLPRLSPAARSPSAIWTLSAATSMPVLIISS